MSEEVNEIKNDNFFRKTLKKIKSNKFIEYAFIIMLVIAVIIIFSTSFTKGTNKTTGNEDSVIDEYVSKLENRLKNSISKIDGVGEVEVAINVKSGMETVLAMETITTENSNGTTVTETPILINGKTVVLKEKYPEIAGALIVAEGAENFSTYQKIQAATVSLLNINVNDIEILAMKIK